MTLTFDAAKLAPAGVGPLWPKELTTKRACGVTWTDEYAWIQDPEHPNLAAALAAEARHRSDVLGPLEADAERYAAAILGYIDEADVSPAERDGPYEYTEHRRPGVQYPLLTRRLVGDLGGGEQTVVDVDVLAADLEYLDLGGIAFTPSHQRMAVLLDSRGDERYAVHVYDMSQGPPGPGVDPIDVLEDVNEVLWVDEEQYWYIRADAMWRSCEAWRHIIGRDAALDELIFEEVDTEYAIGLGRTRTDQYLEIATASATTAEVWLAPVETAGAARTVEELRASLQCFRARQEGVQYSVEHWVASGLVEGENLAGLSDDSFLILTNDEGASDFALWSVPEHLRGWERDSWHCLVPEATGSRLEGVAAFERHLALEVRRAGLTTVDLSVVGAPVWEAVPLPVGETGPYTVALGVNADFATPLLRYCRTGPCTPDEVYDVTVATRVTTLIKRYSSPGYVPGRYVGERIWVEQGDVMIPVTVIHRTGLLLDGQAPALVTAYGAYAESLDPSFEPTILPLLDDGWVYAIAHVRGGGELGRSWYEGGKGSLKDQTFTDFGAVLRALIARKYTGAGRIVVRGRSAGGLVAGNALMRSCDLLAGVIAEVPFVDALNTMCDPDLPLVIGERSEWGDPLASREDLERIRAWSPYEQVTPQSYPAVMLTGGANDPRVSYWEPLKFAARLRACTTSTRPIIVQLDPGAGHFGPSGCYDALLEEARVQAFARWAVESVVR